jgi:cytoskeletal protein RodZ
VKRGAIASAVVGLLLFADGSYLIARKNQVGGDTGALFGNSHFFLSAGTVVVISSLLLILGAAVMWAVAVWRETRPADGGGRVSQRQVSRAPASDAQVSEAEVSEAEVSQEPTQAGAGNGQIREGQSHQRQS